MDWPPNNREAYRGIHPFRDLENAGRALNGSRQNAMLCWGRETLRSIESPDRARHLYEEKTYYLRAKNICVRTWVDKERVDMDATGKMVHVGHLELTLRNFDVKQLVDLIKPFTERFYYEQTDGSVMVSYEGDGWGFTGKEALEHVYYPDVPTFDYAEVKDGVVRKVGA